ncbi:MAG: hypothetical protein AMS25_14785 [Gemmatimonas sp. SM23_52]|nr:MAG: hypothetical protein AMS25_14785 [Gemmatimonas sp. SM23_52]
MIESPQLLEELESRYEREALEGMTYEVALQRFAALWAEAQALGVDARDDWLADLEPDLAIARTLNGLAPST